MSATPPPEADTTRTLEAQIDQWRHWVLARRALTPDDAAELEDNLRGRVDDLRATGLDDDEAFLVAVKRMGGLDDVSREFAREHSERLWKQLVLLPAEPAGAAPPDADLGPWRGLGILLALAIGAGLAVKALVTADDGFRSMLNIGFAVLPFLATYFVLSRRVPWRVVATLAAIGAALALTINLYPLVDESATTDGMTLILTITHLPVLLWLLFGVTYMGGAWREHGRRMDFVRFTGEQIIYFALLAIGGGLLTGLLLVTFDVVGIDIEAFIGLWLMPFAVPGAFLVAAWLVEAKKAVVENIAPVLTRVFTPLTLVLLVATMVALLVGDPLADVDRVLLVVMDAILILVLALLLYSISARDPLAPPTAFDRLQLALVVAAFAVNALALTAMVTRIADAGWTANKTAALGLNVVLLVHLVGTGWHLARFVRARGGFGAVEQYQTRYLPVYAGWAAVVVIGFPPLFGFA